MGNCVGERSRNRYKTKIQKHDQIPNDTEDYKNLNIIKLPFSAIFGNVKVKKCPYKSIGIKISIDEEQYYKLGNKTVQAGEDIKWKIDKKIDFMKTEYEIRKSFLIIDLINQDEEKVATLRINLYLISIGPYHQDFLLNFKNNKVGRISFDFKVSQLIEMSLQSLQTQINLSKKHPGENFSFSIKTIVRNYTKISLPSYAVQVIVDQKMSSKQIQINHEDEKKNSIPKKKSFNGLISTQIKQLKQGSNLIWRKIDCQQMPSVDIKILMNQLHHSYFQMLLIRYDISNEQQQQSNRNNKQAQQRPSQTSIQSQQQQRYIKQQLFAQCYIAFHKLFTTQPQTFFIQNSIYEKRFISLQQKLWIHGRQIGRAKLIFHVQNQKYIKQMQVCVRTQQGIQKTSPIFVQDQDTRQQTCKQIDQLSKLSQYVQLHIIQLQQCQTNYHQIRRLKSIIQSSLTNMLPILSKTSKQSIICYTYSSPKQMIKSQKVLINIGGKISAYVYEEDEAISQLCWLVLIAIIRRDQFRLSHIGFDDGERKQIQMGKLNKLTKKKIQVGLMYQQFMYKLLAFALKSLNFKGSSIQRTFAELFCAYAYFRIPEFRLEMLSVITYQDDAQVPEWRGIEFSLNQDLDYTVLKQDVDSFTALFDWHHCFHKCLQKIKSQKSNNQTKQDSLDLEEILANQSWKYRFRKRGPAFFCFIKYWISYVQALVVKSRDIQWKYFPGYNRLLKAFFIQLKQRKVLQYPDSLKQTAYRLIANEKIFSPVVAILFNKTSIYDPLTVIKVIQFINQLLSNLKKKNKSIHPLFDYSHFFKGIRMIFESQFLFMLETTLIMLYTHYEMFNYNFKKNLCIYLLKNVFFKMFLHWSVNIRNIFHHFLVYRIAYDIQLLGQKEKDTDVNNIKLRNDYIKVIKNHYQNTFEALQWARKQTINKNKIRQVDVKFKQLHTIMKKRLMNKKLDRAKKQLLSPGDNQNQFPQSQNENNSNIFDRLRRNYIPQKPKYEQPLVQPRVQRSQSQCIPQIRAQLIYRNLKIGKIEQEVIVLNRPSSLTVKNKIVDTTLLRNDTETNDFTVKALRNKDLSPISKLFEQIAGQLTSITEQERQYIEKAMHAFKQVKDLYKKTLEDGKILEAPKIHRQDLYIDLKDYIPEKIDDW